MLIVSKLNHLYIVDSDKMGGQKEQQKNKKVLDKNEKL
jgi:hypothetical protein